MFSLAEEYQISRVKKWKILNDGHSSLEKGKNKTLTVGATELCRAGVDKLFL